MTTWTLRELASNARRRKLDLWRVVEAQHVAATMQLADSIADQALLESILEESKPQRPSGTEPLHYLLSTPFRYHAPTGSRFRAAFEAGVWYGAQELRTALAEKGYWQLRFLLDSPETPDLKPIAHTAFQASVRGLCLDLMGAPLARDRLKWTSRTDYGATQRLAAMASEVQISLIRYESVRDPQRGACVVALTPDAFRLPKPIQYGTWFIAVSRERVRCMEAERHEATWEFAASQLM